MPHRDHQYPYKLLPKYPGLRPRDEVIWDEFVRRNPSAFEYVYYDMHVGDPARDPHERAAMKASGAYEVTQWCIDAIGYAKGVAYIIEIKPNAGASAIGQVLAYKSLLVRERRVDGDAIPVILTDEISPIFETSAYSLGILVLTP